MGNRVIQRVIPPEDDVVIWTSQAVTISGQWSIDYTAAGFSEILSVIPVAVSSAGSVYDIPWAGLSGAPGLTAAAGYAIRGSNMSLLGLGPTVRNAEDGTVIKITVIGR